MTGKIFRLFVLAFYAFFFHVETQHFDATLRLTVISRLKLMGFDTSPHAHRKKFVLKYSIKSKYQQNIDYNQLHNIIADITVIMSKMQNVSFTVKMVS